VILVPISLQLGTASPSVSLGVRKAECTVRYPSKGALTKVDSREKFHLFHHRVRYANLHSRIVLANHLAPAVGGAGQGHVNVVSGRLARTLTVLTIKFLVSLQLLTSTFTTLANFSTLFYPTHGRMSVPEVAVARTG